MRIALVAALMLTAVSAQADVSLVGTLKERALLSVNGGAPRTFPVGATLPDGSRLVGVTSGEATIEDGGKRYVIRLGEYAASRPDGGGNSMVLSPDTNGHYAVDGAINGVPVKMMLDTGATLVSIPASMAARMGIDYKNTGRRAATQTAAGTAPVWIVKLDKVKVGTFEFSNVDGSINEAGLNVILLGNSVLKRLDMKTESGLLTLTKRF